MSATYRHFRLQTAGDVVIVRLTVSNLQDQLPSFELKNELLRFVEQERPEKLVISFENVERFSTEFIGTLLSTKKRHSTTRMVKLCCLQTVHREIFRVLNLDGTVFEICDTVNDALGAF